MKIRSPYFKKQFDLAKAQLIGQGNFAQVFRIFDTDMNDSLAIRKVKKNDTDLEDITKEKVINEELKKVQNENILKIYDIIDTEDAVWYITEYCSGGSLWDVLNLCKDNKMNEKDCLQCVLQISKGVQQLHNHRITHRDLKPQNILLKTKYIQNKPLPLVKLADFGLSTQKIIMETIAGTKQYIAPEQAKFHNYTNAVDVWSLGIICDQILHGTPFYSGENNKQVFNKILKTPYQVRDQSIRESIQNLLTSLLKKKPYERPIIAVIRKTIQKILQEIQTEAIALKIEKSKKKEMKVQNLSQSSNLTKYSNMLGLESRRNQQKKVLNEVKQRSKENKPQKDVKSPQPNESIGKLKKEINILPLYASSGVLKSSREQSKDEIKKVGQIKRQNSSNKPQGEIIKESKQTSILKTKISEELEIIGDLNVKENPKQINPRSIEPKKQEKNDDLDEFQLTDSLTVIPKNTQNFQIPIFKLQKKKVIIPQSKKQIVKSDFLQVKDYVQKLIQKKKQLKQTSIIKVQKIPSFLPNTFFTSQQFTVASSHTTEAIAKFKKQFQILNYIQYNDEYDGNLYKKSRELQKDRQKCTLSMKSTSEQLKIEFMKQVDNYVELYLEKFLK